MVPRSRRPWKITVSASDIARPPTRSATAADASASMSARCSRSSASSMMPPTPHFLTTRADSSSCTVGTSVRDRAAEIQDERFDMKIIYKPIGLMLGVIGGILGRQAFNQIWQRVDDEEPPEPTTRDRPLARIVLAVGLQAMIFALVRMTIQRT